MNGPLVIAGAILGVVGSAHCVGMCGGVVSVLSSGRRDARGDATGQFAHAAGFHLGRIVSYSVAGAVAGSFGAMSSALPLVRDAQVGLRFVAAVVVLLVGLHLAGWLPGTGARGPSRGGGAVLRRLLARALPLRSAAQAAYVGLLWALLPCGVLYGALAVAATSGSATDGALIMAAFAAGTLPLLALVTTFAARITALAPRPWVRRGAGALLMLVAAFQLVTATAQARALHTGHAAAAHACCAPHAHDARDSEATAQGRVP